MVIRVINFSFIILMILSLATSVASTKNTTGNEKNQTCGKFFLSGKITGETFSSLSNLMISPCLEKNIPATLVISSEGGSVSTALAIYDSVQMNKATSLTTVATGSVASSAVLIYLSGNNRLISPHASIFLHPIRVYVKKEEITELELKEKLESMRNLKKSYIQILVKETSLTREQAEDIMMRGKSFNAEEAVEHGFAHEITE